MKEKPADLMQQAQAAWRRYIACLARMDRLGPRDHPDAIKRAAVDLLESADLHAALFKAMTPEQQERHIKFRDAIQRDKATSGLRVV